MPGARARACVCVCVHAVVGGACIHVEIDCRSTSNGHNDTRYRLPVDQMRYLRP